MARKTETLTRRPVVMSLEAIMGEDAIPVLDHGFVRIVDYMGDDGAIVQAARVSYGRGTKTVSEDRGLIRYLMRHRHTTPFEMCVLKLHVKLPIFVARQWIRHRTASVNEYSARYSILDREFYVPAPEHLATQATGNRQGRDEVLEPLGLEAARVLEILKVDAERAYENYEELLNQRDGEIIDPANRGLARELARLALPVSFYTQWYWKTDLHNLFHFLNLRLDPHAQYEIRAYAEVIATIVKSWVPLAYGALEEYVIGGVNLSATGLKLVRAVIDSVDSVDGLALAARTQEESGLSKREWQELLLIFR